MASDPVVPIGIPELAPMPHATAAERPQPREVRFALTPAEAELATLADTVRHQEVAAANERAAQRLRVIADAHGVPEGTTFHIAVGLGGALELFYEAPR